MSLLDVIVSYLFRREQRNSYVRAIAHERASRPSVRSRAAAIAEAKESLADRHALTFGTLPDGSDLRVSRAVAFMSALVVGAVGSGKTRLLVGLLLDLLNEWIRQLGTKPSAPLGFHLELSDPKFETFDLLFTGRGLSTDRAVEILIDTAERALYAEPYSPASR